MYLASQSYFQVSVNLTLVTHENAVKLTGALPDTSLPEMGTFIF